MFWRKLVCLLLLFSLFGLNTAQAGIAVIKSNGITLTGADGVQFVGVNGITLTGADGFLNYRSNGITLTGADGITLTGADGITLTGADGSTFVGSNGITLTGADGITLTGADGITLTGADGITLTGADGTNYRADSIVVRRPNGITLTGADGITLTGADGFNQSSPTGITLTGADGITLTGADGITLTGADGITLTGADAQQPAQGTGLQSVDPELALRLNQITDDSSVNAIIVFHRYPTDADLAELQALGVVGGTRYRVLPVINVTTTRAKLFAVSRLAQVRSIYGNRTLNFNADPYFNITGLPRVAPDRDLQTRNNGFPVSGRGVTVAVLDTGVNSQHNDLAGRVVQNVKLADSQSAGVGFIYPLPIENLVNTDLTSGHGSFVAGVVAASGVTSGGRYGGVAPGARILGLSAGDLNLSHVLSGFDYVLERGANYNVRVINCSFSANAVFDYNDPVNVATKMLTERGVNVVFSAGNTGAGNGTLNPYAVAPWVVSVGATDQNAKLAPFSSRGMFGNSLQKPSLVAPGVNVVSLRSAVTQTGILGVAFGLDAQRLTPGELPFYTTASGTSFSAPQVAGAIALMLEANPNLTPAKVKDILQRTATPLAPYYQHEVGAGMLNVHAAALEAAFANRKMGLFRAILESSGVKFTTAQLQSFNNSVVPRATATASFQLPADTIQATVNVAWGDMWSPNDLGLKLFDAAGSLRGESNDLNLPGFTGRREKITIEQPASGAWQTSIAHTGGIGTLQTFNGTVDITKVNYAPLNDFNSLSAAQQQTVKESLRHALVLAEGNRFRPSASVTRADFSAALLRGARVPQYLANGTVFADVRDTTTRTAVESAYFNPGGNLIYDAQSGAAFRPDAATTRLIAAVALVKAAGLQNEISTTPLTVADAVLIPAAYRGYVAVALAKGFLITDGNNFAASRALTRMELAQAMVALNRFFAAR